MAGNKHFIEKEHLAHSKLMNGARVLLECLRKEGVDEIFGYPGGVVLNIYDELYKCDFIKHYLVRHEQAAIHAAEGYARTTGKVGVAITTSGPGATNALTGIANAYLDGYPIVVITGQVSVDLIGKDSFQEVDIVGITRSCCKHNYLVKDLKELPRIIKEAFYIARTGKPGPVVIDLPKDITTQKIEFKYPDKIDLPGYNINYNGSLKQISNALKVLYDAKRPVIILGGGVVASEASKEILEFAKYLHIPVANTLMGIGTFPADDKLSLGMLGMHGNYWANFAVQNCDVLLAIGTRFSDRVTSHLKNFCAEAIIIHIDIDPCSISKNVYADIPIVGDAKNIISEMLNQIKKKEHKINVKLKDLWFEQINEWKKNKTVPTVSSEKLLPQNVIQTIYNLTKDINPIICTEVGQHQMWTTQFYQFNKPRQFITSGGLGTMGFGFPAAIGAAVAHKDKTIINIAGDGSIQMNIQELMTCVDYNLNVKVFIINNGYLGMVRQWQEKNYNKHYSQTNISSPDYVKLAEAYGALGFRVEKTSEIEPTIKKALEHQGPVFVDFIVEPFEMVYPWVLAGNPINEILLSNEVVGLVDEP